MEQDIQFLRLKNGEDIITEVQENAGSLVLINPCKILYLKGKKSGFLSISLMQWVFSRISADQMFEIDKNEVLFKTLPDDGMIVHYFNSVEHFLEKESSSNIEYDDPTIDDSYEDNLEMLKDLIGTKDDKGKLH
jgi:hypothetical protein